MKRHKTYNRYIVLCIVCIWLTVFYCIKANADELAHWQQTQTKERIQNFVSSVTTPGSESFIPPEKRIAVFDNDGTLMCEQPVYAQLAFEIFWLNKQSADNPELLKQPLFAAAAKGEIGEFFRSVESYDKAVQAIYTAHKGTLNTAYKADVAQFLDTQKHPRFNIPYPQCFYAPMQELIEYLQKREFKVFICSGSEQEFLRGFSRQSYNIPQSQVIGSYVKLVPEKQNGTLLLKRGDRISDNNRLNKAANIGTFAGICPVFVVGNSSGDIGMMQFAKSANQPYMCALVCHDDAKREYAYVDKLAQKRAENNNWMLISMSKDWKTVFAPSPDKN